MFILYITREIRFFVFGFFLSLVKKTESPHIQPSLYIFYLLNVSNYSNSLGDLQSWTVIEMVMWLCRSESLSFSGFQVDLFMTICSFFGGITLMRGLKVDSMCFYSTRWKRRRQYQLRSSLSTTYNRLDLVLYHRIILVLSGVYFQIAVLFPLPQIPTTNLLSLIYSVVQIKCHPESSSTSVSPSYSATSLILLICFISPSGYIYSSCILSVSLSPVFLFGWRIGLF